MILTSSDSNLVPRLESFGVKDNVLSMHLRIGERFAVRRIDLTIRSAGMLSYYPDYGVAFFAWEGVQPFLKAA